MSLLKYDDKEMPYIPLDNLNVRLENDEPTEAVREKARTELRETPDVVVPALEELRRLLKSELIYTVEMVCGNCQQLWAY